MSQPINDGQLKKLIEARIFIAEKPISLKEIMSSVLDDYSVTPKRVKTLLEKIKHDYIDRGVNLVESGEAYSFQTSSEINEPLSKAIAEKPPNYSKAALETLAIIAYKQPITRAEIEEIRGVGVSKQIMKMFAERGFIRKVGHKELPGRPVLFGTTVGFQQHFQLKSLDQLPALRSVSDDVAAKAASQMAIPLDDDNENTSDEVPVTEDDIEKEFPDE